MRSRNEGSGSLLGYRIGDILISEGKISREQLEEARAGAVETDYGDLDLGEASPDEAPIIRLVSAILQRAVGDGASDVHMEPQATEVKVRMRVDGVLRKAMSIPSNLQNGVISRLKILATHDLTNQQRIAGK